MNKPLIYLASPYTRHGLSGAAKRSAETRRFEMVAKAAAFFMDQGHHIFCPIAHTHPLWKYGLQEKDGTWWLDQDFVILDLCDQLWVYMLEGWKESYGVQEEIKFAQKRKIPVFYVEPLEDE